MRIVSASLFALLLLFSCSPAKPPSPEPLPPVVPEKLALDDLVPTSEELAWLDHRRRSREPLLAATIQVPGTFEQHADGTRSGLDWDLLKEFARVLDLNLEIRVPEDLKRFFSNNGVIPADVETNVSHVYTPDLLKTVDLYVGPFSVLPWRERLMAMIPLYPMQNFLVGRKGEEIRSTAQLAGKRFAVLKDSMQDNLLHDFADRQGLKLKYIYVSSDTDVFAQVADHRSDYALDGGLFFSQNQKRMKALSLSGFDSDPVRVGWATKKSNQALVSLVRKYFIKVQENGSFGRFFAANYGTSFDDYMKILTTSIPLEEKK